MTFIIFAHARSGSSTLRNILSQFIEVDYEPFNRCHLLSNQRSSVENYLQRLAGRKAALKHIYYDPHLSIEEDKKLLSEIERVIFLRRKNLLKTTISFLVSRQTGIWTGDENTFNNAKFSMMSIARIRKTIEKFEKTIAFWEEWLTNSSNVVYQLYYEDFLGEDVTFANRIDEVKKIIAFLGLNDLKDCSFEELKSFKKMNSELTYKNISNIDEIERTFSAEYGTLL